MNRGITLVGASLLLSAGCGPRALVAQGAARPGLSKTAAKQAPKFEVDPMWPKPMGNRWILGSTTGVAVDSRDHIFVVHLTDSFTPRTEIGLTVGGAAVRRVLRARRRTCSSTTRAARSSTHWGGPGEGLRLAGTERRSRDRRRGQRLDRRRGRRRFENSQVLEGRQVHRAVRQGSGRAPAGRPAGAGRSAGDTAYAGVSPGRGAAGRGGGRGGRGGRGAGAPALPANSNSMESFGGAMGFAFDGKANEIFVADGSRNHRVAVVDMNTGAIKRVLGRVRRQAGRRRYGQVRAGRRGAEAVRRTVRCAKLANDGLVYVCDATNDRIQVFKKDGSFVKRSDRRPSDARHAARCGTSRSRATRSRSISTSPTART